MFENILHQPVIERIRADILSDSLAPAILFSGPEYGGKGTAALELARVLSCEAGNAGTWNCPCPSCVRHRNLVSPDLLLLGRRRFFEEAAAAAAAFLRNSGGGEGGRAVRMLFIRSLRKLLARFDPVLWEEDPRLGKIRPCINALEEDLEDFESLTGNGAGRNGGELETICGGLLKKAARLEAEGLGELVPIARIRRAAYWSRLAPLGKHKCFIIENAEHMQEGAKNALLKILEEPPPRLTILLTSSRPMSLLPTMLSRLRDYRFVKRKNPAEEEVILRIFRDRGNLEEGKFHTIESYLASFLPMGGGILYPLASWFAASAAAEAARELRRRGRDIPPVLTDLGAFTARIAGQGGMGRPAADAGRVVEKIIRDTGGFETPGLFSQFLKNTGLLLSAWLRSGPGSPAKSAWAELWRRELGRAVTETASFNIAPPLALERLLEALKRGMCA
ncbi:MAG: DNA polymerase III [Treponema sp.]|nr:DNA polymerase III [Treponema sp.]